MKQEKQLSNSPKDVEESLIRILMQEPPQSWGVSDLAQKLKITRSLVHYHLKKLVTENRVIQDSDKKYSWKPSPLENDQKVRILGQLNARRNLSREEFKSLLETELDEEEEVEKVTQDLFNGDFITFDAGVEKIGVGPKGSKLLGTCYACGEKLEDGSQLFLEDFYEWPEDTEYQLDAYVHKACATPVISGAKDKRDLCESCHLPLGLRNLLGYFVRPISLHLAETFLFDALYIRELRCYQDMMPEYENWNSYDYLNECVFLNEDGGYFFSGTSLKKLESLLSAMNGYAIKTENDPLYPDSHSIMNRAFILYKNLSQIRKQEQQQKDKLRNKIILRFYGEMGLFYTSVIRNELLDTKHLELIRSDWQNSLIYFKNGLKYHPMCYEGPIQKKRGETNGGN